MATRSFTRIPIITNKNYKPSGLKSYAYALHKCTWPFPVQTIKAAKIYVPSPANITQTASAQQQRVRTLSATRSTSRASSASARP